MNCKICGKNSDFLFKNKILNKYTIQYFKCVNCDFVQTEKEYWLSESYNDSINFTDVGYINRNLLYSRKLPFFLLFFFGKNSKFLDYAGGYGVFVRLMRDVGFDYYWDDKYTNNLFSKGFESKPFEKYDAITLFEVFEHFENPIEEINFLFNKTETIIFSTEVFENTISADWWYLGLDHGQHIAIYSKKTFNYIAQIFKCNFYSCGSLHFLTKKTISNWELNLLRLHRIGFNIFLKYLLTSRTTLDYNYLKKL